MIKNNSEFSGDAFTYFRCLETDKPARGIVKICNSDQNLEDIAEIDTTNEPNSEIKQEVITYKCYDEYYGPI